LNNESDSLVAAVFGPGAIDGNYRWSIKRSSSWRLTTGDRRPLRSGVTGQLKEPATEAIGVVRIARLVGGAEGIDGLAAIATSIDLSLVANRWSGLGRMMTGKRFEPNGCLDHLWPKSTMLLARE
jgi:hypothetical protein